MGRRLDPDELLLEALVAEREGVVVQAEEVQDRGVQVPLVDGVLRDVVAEVVGLAVDRSRLDSPAGQPHRVAARMVVAPVVVRLELALRVDGAPELSAPDDERVLEQPALGEVGDQCRSVP